MDQLEFFKQLNNASNNIPVKEEEPDQPADFQQARSSNTPPGLDEPDEEEEELEVEPPTGMSQMNMEMEEAMRKEEEDTKKMMNFMMREEPPAKKKRGKEEEKRKDDEFKAPLTTFGHSSRPRRSVNYASIERGDEAQSQSLVQEFGSGKKRQKRTRDELDENYDQEKEIKRRPARQNHRYTPSNSTMSAAKTIIMNSRTADDEFRAIAPKPKDERPEMSQRTFLKQLEELPAIRRASGGFRRYVMWFSDDAALKLLETVKRRCNLTTQNEMEQFLQSLRHVYNSMSRAYRREWEQGARSDIQDSNKFLGTSLVMPMTEILENSREKYKGQGVRPNCCSDRPLLTNMLETIEHYMAKHDVVHFFGCDFCYKVYPTRYELTKHVCPEFTTLMYELVTKGQTLILESAYMYLCCTQCGIWLPVKANSIAMKGWTYFATALMNHSCQPLAPVVVYFRKPLPEEGKNVRMTFQVIPFINVGFPLSCEKCGIEEFESFAETEEHFKQKHDGIQCEKCPKKFGTEFAYRHHQQCHISSSAQFANYLLYSATYEPPPKSQRSRHIGFDTEIPISGGMTSGEVQIMEAMEKREFVEPFENAFRRKLFQWKGQKGKKKKENRASESTGSSPFSLEPGESSGEEEFQKSLKKRENESSTSSSSSETDDSDAVTSNKKKAKQPAKIRGDLGYEFIDKTEFFEKSEAEQEARQILNEVLHGRVLHPRESLRNPEKALKILEDAKEVKMPPIGSKLADEVVALTMRTVQLPAANCIDPLKDFMCLNKIIVHCEKCSEVVSSDVDTHAGECDIKGEDIDKLLTEVYHAAAGPHAGLRCIYPECKVHICSAVGLRFHLFNEHNKNCNVTSLTDSGLVLDEFTRTRYDRSLMGTAKHFTSMQADSRSFLQRMTDIDCFLPFLGVLEGKLQPRPPQRPLPVAIASNRSILSGPSQMADHSMRPPPYIPPPHPMVKHSSRLKPYRVPRTTRWYNCAWCERQYENIDNFIDHLVKTHAHVCLTCGRCFASQNFKRTHVCMRTFGDARKPGTSLSGKCPTCVEIFPIESLYVHVLRRHFTTIDYIHATGELYPVGRDLAVRMNSVFSTGKPRPYPMVQRVAVMEAEYPSTRHEERSRQVRTGMVPSYGLDKDQLIMGQKPPPQSITICPPNPINIDTRLMCYLCELTFSNNEELENHLEEHPEKWAHCPFCGHDVHSHYDLQKHLLTSHVIKISGSLCCSFCQETHRYMGSHMIYRCKRISRCTICGQKSNDPAANRLHIQRTHSLALRRFQCTYCSKQFASVGEFYEHGCTAGGGNVYACSCSPDRFFATPSGFYDHFDSVHVFRHRCKLCDVETTCLDIMIRHRNTHMRTLPGRDQQRKLFVLMRSLFPKPDSGYMKYIEGGPAPPSFEDVDRSQDFLMMGESGPIPMGALNSYSSPPPTLMDVLGRQFASPAAATTIQRVVAPPLRNRTTPPEVVTLESDGEDDECVVVVEKNGQKPNEKSPDSDAFIRTVRVEEEFGYGQTTHAGVVDDDLDVAEEGEASPAAQPIVKEVVDDNGDDELAVVAEVENVVGTLPVNVSAGREKRFKCPDCSLAFFTNHALRSHSKDHKMDAGSTMCMETYGIPLVTSNAWICRNCCIAFEDQKQHMHHMNIHGTSSSSCPECSGIAFNHIALNTHANAHNEKRVHYSCGTCLYQFNSDLQLMDHMSMAHSVPLFYFCKLCNYGSTNADKVYSHIGTHGSQSFTLTQRFGVCPAQVLNYNPADEKAFRLQLLQKKITLNQPSDCAHRAMLLSNDNSITCTTCHCTQSYFNFLANNGYCKDSGRMPTFKQINVDDTRFPLWRHLNEKNADMMIRFGSVQQQQRAHVPNQPNTHYRAQPLTRSVYQAPVVSMTSNGVRVIAPPHSGISRRITVRSNPLPLTRMTNTVSTRCKAKECEKMLGSDFERQLHSMHHSEHNWFCRFCGVTEKSEMQLVQHWISNHLTAAYLKFYSSGFKSCVYQLTCPMPSCNAEFQSLKLFEKHINKEHTKELPFAADCCDARFATKDRCDRHNKLHEQYMNTNNTDASCCPICGTLDLWQVPKNTHIDCIQQHTVRHGLDYRSSCRYCLKQFESDVDLTLAIDHCRQDHSALIPNSGLIHCKLCSRGGMTEEAFAEHCRNYHVFNILLKAHLSQKGELVVTIGEEFRNYVGLPIKNTSVKVAKNKQSTSSVSSANGGNAALLTIAAAIGEPETTMNGIDDDDDEVYTLD